MVTVTGKVNNATLAGIVRATPDHPFVDTTTTPHTLVSMPIEAAIASGSFSIVVPQSQVLSGSSVSTEGITYYWQLFQSVTTTTYYFLSGAIWTGSTHLYTDGFYYTGSTHDGTSVRLDRVITTNLVAIADGIHAVAPNVSSVDFTDLINIPSQQPYLDISVYRIAELLTTLQIYKDRISAKFTLRGTYNAATSYVLNDVVNYNGSSYAWINASSSAGQTPPAAGTNNTYWFCLASIGATGATGFNQRGAYSAATSYVLNDLVNYNGSSYVWINASSSAGQTPPAAGTNNTYWFCLSAKGVDGTTVDLSNYYQKSETVPRNNAVFTGSTKRATMTYPVATGDVATEIPTAQYVESAILAKNYGVFQPPLIFARRVGQQSSDRDVSTVIFWDNRVINTGTILDTTGRFVVPTAGDYLIFFTGLFEYSGSAGSSSSRATTSLLLSIDNGGGTFTDVGNILFENDQSQAATWRDRKQGIMYAPSLAISTTYTIRSLLAGSGLNSTGHTISPGGGGTNNYFLLWKVG